MSMSVASNGNKRPARESKGTHSCRASLERPSPREPSLGEDLTEFGFLLLVGGRRNGGVVMIGRLAGGDNDCLSTRGCQSRRGM